MKKILYCLPAVFACMLYGLLAALAGGVGGFQLIAWIYLLCPIAAAVLLTRDKWWGSLFGVVMGAVMAWSAMTAEPQVIAVFTIGLIAVAYYCVMGLVCAGSNKK